VKVARLSFCVHFDIQHATGDASPFSGRENARVLNGVLQRK
jgi:hypothetical protein